MFKGILKTLVVLPLLFACTGMSSRSDELDQTLFKEAVSNDYAKVRSAIGDIWSDIPNSTQKDVDAIVMAHLSDFSNRTSDGLRSNGFVVDYNSKGLMKVEDELLKVCPFDFSDIQTYEAALFSVIETNRFLLTKNEIELLRTASVVGAEVVYNKYQSFWKCDSPKLRMDQPGLDHRHTDAIASGWKEAWNNGCVKSIISGAVGGAVGGAISSGGWFGAIKGAISGAIGGAVGGAVDGC